MSCSSFDGDAAASSVALTFVAPDRPVVLDIDAVRFCEVLTNLLSSHDGAALAAMPQAPDQLVREIDRLFPGAMGLAGERVHTDWTNDPYSLGAYVCCAPGQWEAAQADLHRPHGRLWLAGEHADDHTGFMEGALRSGRRVAAAIIGSRDHPTTPPFGQSRTT